MSDGYPSLSLNKEDAMTDILIATKNQHKLSEFTAMLGPLGYRLRSLFDHPDIGPIVEDGDTFEANALRKARALAVATNTAVLADDSGLVVEALDGAPGVISARYAGDDASDQDNNERLVREMDHQLDRRAHFVTVICLVVPGEEPRYFHGRLDGVIATTYRGDHGFGYDPLFVLPDGRHLAELGMEEKNAISHRARALRSLLDYLNDHPL
jgi:XTP/dITP diphosphohydrolase